MVAEGTVVVGLELLDRARDRAIAEAARRLAGPGAEILLLHVHPVTKTAVLDYVKLESPEVLTEQIDAATEMLEEIAKGIGGPVQVDVALGHLPEILLDRAKDAALLVIGRTHKGAIGRVLEGSVESRLAHDAPCPLVIVP